MECNLLQQLLCINMVRLLISAHLKTIKSNNRIYPMVIPLKTLAVVEATLIYKIKTCNLVCFFLFI